MGKKQRIQQAQSMKQLNPPTADSNRRRRMFTHSKLKDRIDHCIEVLCRSPWPWHDDPTTEMLNLRTKLRFLKDHYSDIEDCDLYAELLLLQFDYSIMLSRRLKEIIIITILEKVESIYFPWEQLKDINNWRSTCESSNGRRLLLRLLILNIPCLKFLLIHLFNLLFRLAFSLFYFVCMMEKCKDMILKVLSNKIQRYELEPGDHIYTWRRAYSYAHHGIYVGGGIGFFVGEGNVIHLTRGAGHILLSSSRSHPSDNPSGHQSTYDHVVESSLDSFLSGGDLYRFEYGVNLIFFLAKVRGGTCTLAPSDRPEIVVHRATTLLKKGFGVYNLSENNCEDFAIYCKTSRVVDDSNCVRRSIGRSGQAASWLGGIVVCISSLFRLSTSSSTWLAFVGFFIYCIFRAVSDIGVRCNVRKVEIEELGAALERFGRSSRRTLLDYFKPYLVPMIYLFLGILLCEIYWADAIILYGMFM